MANEVQKRPSADVEMRQRYKQEVDKRVDLLKPLLGDIAPDQAKAVLYQAAASAPELMQCTPASLIRSLAICIQLGLMPGPQGYIYLIPRGGECTVQAGYKGYLHLALKSGIICRASVVYRQDVFSVDEGLQLTVQHTPNLDHEGKDDDLIAAYAFATLPNGVVIGDWMRRSELLAVRRRAASKSGPWATDFARMCRKSAIRRLFQGGTVPMSNEMARLIEAEMEDEAIEATPERPASSLDRVAGILPDPIVDPVEPSPMAQLTAELADCPDAATVYQVRDQWARDFDTTPEWEPMLVAVHARLQALK